MTINNVNIGDKFNNGKHTVCEVIDFNEVTSFVTGSTIRYECVVKGVGTLATNSFIVPFSTVVRNKINKMENTVNWDDDFEEDEIPLDENCPNCGRTYDEIDFEYQICHYCKFNNTQD